MLRYHTLVLLYTGRISEAAETGYMAMVGQSVNAGNMDK